MQILPGLGPILAISVPDFFEYESINKTQEIE